MTTVTMSENGEVDEESPLKKRKVEAEKSRAAVDSEDDDDLVRNQPKKRVVMDSDDEDDE